MKHLLIHPLFRNHILLSYRGLWLSIFLLTMLSMGFAFYLQYIVKLEVCNLCMLQRAIMISLGSWCLLAFLHHPKAWGQWVYCIGTTVLSLLGVSIAGRHVWLQHLPADRIPACGPDFAYMMDAFPITESLLLILQGSGDCAEIKWTLLGLSIPEQLLFVFIGFTGLSLIQAARVKLKITSPDNDLATSR